jgi:phosphonate degradation associated HDIG domain protein
LNPIAYLRRSFETLGSRPYAGEAITQAEHALQCAQLAESSGASDEVVAAALLHDIGHMVVTDDEDLASRGIDAKHEARGARYLTQWFAPAVTEPIRLHVLAKAYLCGSEPDYYASLSPISKRSLGLQGGPMGVTDAAAFLNEPYAREAVLIRRWDDQAKQVGKTTPDLDHFLRIVQRTVHPSSNRKATTP